jgi:hypothetical protein
MPNLNEFLKNINVEENILDENIQIIKQMRPCSKCDLYVESYEFNTNSMEMYWKCKDGHETRYSVG